MSGLLSAVGWTFVAFFAFQSLGARAQDGAGCPSPGQAQGNIGCTSSQASDPPRTVYDCGSGLLIEAESYAELQSLPAVDQCGSIDLELNNRAVLIDVTPGSGYYQIRTPHAIASVRGTRFLVDVEALQTAVFVVEGVVAVERTDGTGEVELEAGEGVTVTAGEPLVATVWPAGKVTALLARFGR